MAQIADRTNLSRDAVRRLAHREVKFVRRTVAEAIVDAFDELAMTPAPLGRSATRARNDARFRGWHSPLAFDDIDNDVAPVRGAVTCRVDGCAKEPRSLEGNGLCDMHYRRLLRNGAPEALAQMGRHRGTGASYNAVHLRLGRDRGQAKTFPCVDCGERARTWSYDHADPGEIFDDLGRPYSLNQDHYQPRCGSCHNRFDRAFRKKDHVDDDRLDRILELDEMHTGIDEVCAALGIGRDALWKWCDKQGRRDLYARISGRTRTMPNQWTGVA
jgi:hypothetical protein